MFLNLHYSEFPRTEKNLFQHSLLSVYSSNQHSTASLHVRQLYEFIDKAIERQYIVEYEFLLSQEERFFSFTGNRKKHKILLTKNCLAMKQQLKLFRDWVFDSLDQKAAANQNFPSLEERCSFEGFVVDERLYLAWGVFRGLS